jgi:hypothetical protein
MIRHMLSALAAMTLIAAVAAGPASAQSDTSHKQEMEYLKQDKWLAPSKSKAPKGVRHESATLRKRNAKPRPVFSQQSRVFGLDRTG